MKLTKKANDHLFLLQRKYGTGNTAPWRQVAQDELMLPEYKIVQKKYREEYSEILGLFQRNRSQKAPWLVKLDMLAVHLDKLERQAA